MVRMATSTTNGALRVRLQRTSALALTVESPPSLALQDQDVKAYQITTGVNGWKGQEWGLDPWGSTMCTLKGPVGSSSGIEGQGCSGHENTASVAIAGWGSRASVRADSCHLDPCHLVDPSTQ